MGNIDFSKAPEGATHYIEGTIFDENHIQWLMKVEGGYMPYSQLKEEWLGVVNERTILHYKRPVIRINYGL